MHGPEQQAQRRSTLALRNASRQGFKNSLPLCRVDERSEIHRRLWWTTLCLSTLLPSRSSHFCVVPSRFARGIASAAAASMPLLNWMTPNSRALIDASAAAGQFAQPAARPAVVVIIVLVLIVVFILIVILVAVLVLVLVLVAVVARNGNDALVTDAGPAWRGIRRQCRG